MRRDKREISIVRFFTAEYLKEKTHTSKDCLQLIRDDGEINESSLIRKFRITASDGKCDSSDPDNLDASSDQNRTQVRRWY